MSLEPINPEVWRWFYEVIGKGKCTVVDTYWQTETGAHLATNIPGIDSKYIINYLHLGISV